MPLKEGDVVTVSFNPVITITQYAPVKPMVSIQRKLNKEPDKDLADVMVELKRAYFRALADEIKIQNDAHKDVERTQDAKGIYARCMQEIKDAKAEPTIQITPRA